MEYFEFLLEEYEEETKKTRKMLERVPDGKFDWKPHDKSMTLGRLASHVAEIPGWAVQTVRVDTLEFTRADAPFNASSVQQLLEKFDRDVAEGGTAIASLTQDQLDVLWTLKFEGQTIIEMKRAAVLRNMVMNHLIHHRAQLGVYLRLLDLPIPGMYGRSADEMGGY